MSQWLRVCTSLPENAIYDPTLILITTLSPVSPALWDWFFPFDHGRHLCSHANTHTHSNAHIHTNIHAHSWTHTYPINTNKLLLGKK